MPFIFLRLVTLLCCLFMSTSLLARTPEGAVNNRDVNDDGMVDLSEWDKKKSIFNKIDANSDGYLTPDEFAAHWTRRGIPFDKDGVLPNPTFEFLDTDQYIKHSVQYPQGDGPFPGLMLLHSSGGFLSSQFYVKLYLDAGYAVYSPDFFHRHGITHENRFSTWSTYREPIENELTQLIQVMKEDPKIDGENLFAIGFSNGGFWATYLAGTSQVNAASSHYGVWRIEKGRNASCTSYPAYYLGPQSNPLLALHPKHDATQDIYCAKYAWNAAKTRGFEKLTSHIYEQKDVTHAWHADVPRESYKKNDWVVKDSTEKTLAFFEKFKK